jgi:hypothetical protein
MGSDQEKCPSLFRNPEKKTLFLALEWHFWPRNRPDKEFCGSPRST